MARVAICADAHLGNHIRLGGPIECGINKRCREALDVFDRAIDLAVLRKCDLFIVLGDLFHGVKPPPQLIAKVQRSLSRAPYTHLLIGNHDRVSDSFGDHAVGPLCRHNVRIIEHYQIAMFYGLRIVYVPWLPGADALTHITKACDMVATNVYCPQTIMAMHYGIRCKDSPAHFRNVPDAIDLDKLIGICKDYRIDKVFAGHWHEHRIVTPSICQLGALTPTGFGNPGLKGYGAVVILDGKEFDVHELPGPRFIKGEFKETPPVDCHVYFDSVAMADIAKLKATAKGVARKMSDYKTLEEALDNYVKTMKLGQSVDRGLVLEMAKHYLKEATKKSV